MAVTFLLLGVLLFGLILLVAGIILLVALKNKLIGALVTVGGVVFTLLPIAIYLFITISTSNMG